MALALGAPGGCRASRERPDVVGSPAAVQGQAALDAALAGGSGGDPAGTYRLVHCRWRCDPGDPAAPFERGVLVLLPAAAPAPAPLDSLPGPGSLAPGERATGCYALSRLPEFWMAFHARSGAGWFRWRRDAAGALILPLWGDRDGGYTVRAALRSDTLVGVAAEVGAGAAARRLGFVTAVRVGPADPAACRPAARTGEPDRARASRRVT